MTTAPIHTEETPMTPNDHAVAMIHGLPPEHQPYCDMVLDVRNGVRKSLTAPAKFQLDAPTAKHLRGLVDHELLRGVPVTVAAAPLPPVVPKHGMPRRFSLSLVQSAESCLLSAKLGREFGQSGPPAILGRVVHEVLDVLALNAHRDGITRYDEDVAVGMALEALGKPQEAMPLSLEAFDLALDMVRQFAKRMVFWPDADVFITEELVTMNIGASVFSGRIDLTQVRGEEARVDDYKTGMKPPTQGEYEKKLQLPFYATALHRQMPWVTSWNLGEVWVRWNIPRLEQVLASDDLRLENYLKTAGMRLKAAWETDDFPADPGPHCKNCALPERCPVPKALRPDAAFDTVDQAVAGMEWAAATEAQLKKVKTSLRGFMEREELHTLEGPTMAATIESKAREGFDSDTIRAYIVEQGGDVDALVKVSFTNEFKIGKAAA